MGLSSVPRRGCRTVYSSTCPWSRMPGKTKNSCKGQGSSDKPESIVRLGPCDLELAALTPQSPEAAGGVHEPTIGGNARCRSETTSVRGRLGTTRPMARAVGARMQRKVKGVKRKVGQFWLSSFAFHLEAWSRGRSPAGDGWTSSTTARVELLTPRAARHTVRDTRRCTCSIRTRTRRPSASRS